MLKPQNIELYLARIKTAKQETLNLSYLNKLHRNHMLNIPFENLDIAMKNQIRLDINSLYEKVIIKRRGGFCYELNGLFYQLITSLGFEAQLIAARVYNDIGELGPEFDHMAILVKLDNKDILLDVGFGSSFLNPKMIQPGLIQIDYNHYYKIDKTIDGAYILSKSSDSISYQQKFLFTKDPKQFIEFVDMCNYHQTNPKSHFTSRKIITQAKPNGRITLTHEKLSITDMGKREEQEIINHDDFCVKLHQHFNILFEINL